MTGKLLIVEDEFIIAKDLHDIVSKLGFGITGVAKSADEAVNYIKKETPDLVLLDININGNLTGIDLAKIIDRKYNIPYLYVTSYSDTTTINNINETNPIGYILKPFESRDVRVALEISISKIKQIRINTSEKNRISSSAKIPAIIGSSSSLKKTLKNVSQVAPTDVTVLIHGETGTGKELIAEEIHRLSPRFNHKMIKVNCASMPKELIESVLFGHEKGSFTGATDKRIGKFEMANKSTIFLDEIGEMPINSQAKLLRTLQEKEIEIIGGKDTKKVDVRIIAATNRNLSSEVEKGNFRADLFYRLNIFPIAVPPLRSRIDDIPELVTYFLNNFCERIDRKKLKTTPKLFQNLKKYDWPGNIRELQHIIERHTILAEGDTLEITINNDANFKNKISQELNLKSLEEVERRQIINTLEYCGGKIRGKDGAAEILQIHPNTLDFKIKKLGIQKNKLFE